VTKTTSDGICAECWGSKGGRPMGWKQDGPSASLQDDVEDFLGSVFRV
jgi:hypothetical protein